MEPSASERVMQQYCSVCKAHLEMTVVSDASEDGVIWLKCPRCKGILPHMADSTAAEDGPAAESNALDEIDVESAKPYSPSEIYEVGDVIHHRSWDDYGVVSAKAELPGNRRVIVVKFAQHGELQLIEGAS